MGDLYPEKFPGRECGDECDSAVLILYASDWCFLCRICLPEGNPRLYIKMLLEANVLSITENSSANIYI